MHPFIRFVALFWLVAMASAAPARAQSAGEVRVLTFNILAPCWASPSYYPVAVAPWLDRYLRRQAIIGFLKSRADSVDVFALQETTPVELAAIADALGTKWAAFQANHRPDYWSNWIVPEIPWEPNGVALVVRRSRFSNATFEDVALSDSGNHGAIFSGTLSSGERVRVASIHLDSDHASNRKRELGALLDRLGNAKGSRDFIAGDFNFETDAGNLKTDLKRAGFASILEALGTARNTHPWDTKYNGADNWGIIDHVMARNAVPISGFVIDFDLFARYPDDEVSRIVMNLRLCGSDHFAVFASASVR